MNPTDYQREASRTVCDQEAARHRIAWGSDNPVTIEPSNVLTTLLHGSLGVVKEGGEVLSEVEKAVWYGRDLDAAKIEDELGDVLWYAALVCNALSLDLGEVMRKNLAKLKARYPDRWTPEREQNRDRMAETEAMAFDPDDVLPLPRTELTVPPDETVCRSCGGKGAVDVSDGEGGSGPATCGVCSGRGVVSIPVFNVMNPRDVRMPSWVGEPTLTAERTAVVAPNRATGNARPLTDDEAKALGRGVRTALIEQARREIAAGLEQDVEEIINELKSGPRVEQDGHGFGHVVIEGEEQA